MFRVTVVVLITAFSLSAKAGLIFTIEAAGVTHSQLQAPLLVEDFNTLRANTNLPASHASEFGRYSVLSGKPKINSANVWGGDQGSPYLFIPGRSNSQVLLEFYQSVGYFGFWWSAGDRGNRLRVTTESASHEFVSSDIHNSAALSAEHFGNPQRGGNKREPYAFVNLFAEYGKDKIKSILFYGSNFETDNHTVLASLATVRGQRLVEVNEPNLRVLMLLSVVLLLVVWAGRRLHVQK